MKAGIYRKAVLLGGLLALGCAGQARAQMNSSQPGGAGMSHRPAQEESGEGHLPPPPALPGSQAKPATAAPSTKSSSDMSPNEALFDSIDRGDLTAARDAISRGADLNAHNVLGMSPLDLSVDLGRNDISFLLLSLRGEMNRDQQAESNQARSKSGQPNPPHVTKTGHAAS